MGSAAVLLSLLLCAGIWVAALYQRFACMTPGVFALRVLRIAHRLGARSSRPWPQAVGRWIGERGGQLVYGGGNNGLMGVMADATLAAGGRVVGRHSRTRWWKRNWPSSTARSCTWWTTCTSASA